MESNILPKNVIDISGNVHGRIKVLKYLYSKKTITYWLCKCEKCGSESIANRQSIINLSKNICKCEKEEYYNGFIGKRFGSLIVKERSLVIGSGSRYVCQCDCGTIKEIYLGHLLHGDIKSCGRN